MSGFLRRGIDFSSIDGKSAHLVVLFLIASLMTNHLKILSRIALLLNKKAFLMKLLRCSSNGWALSRFKAGRNRIKRDFLLWVKKRYILSLSSGDAGFPKNQPGNDWKSTARTQIESYKKNPDHFGAVYPISPIFLLFSCGSESFLSFWAKMPEARMACIVVIFINAIFSFWQEV